MAVCPTTSTPLPAMAVLRTVAACFVSLGLLYPSTLTHAAMESKLSCRKIRTMTFTFNTSVPEERRSDVTMLQIIHQDSGLAWATLYTDTDADPFSVTADTFTRIFGNRSYEVHGYTSSGLILSLTIFEFDLGLDLDQYGDFVCKVTLLTNDTYWYIIKGGISLVPGVKDHSMGECRFNEGEALDLLCLTKNVVSKHVTVSITRMSDGADVASWNTDSPSHCKWHIPHSICSPLHVYHYLVYSRVRLIKFDPNEKYVCHTRTKTIEAHSEEEGCNEEEVQPTSTASIMTYGVAVGCGCAVVVAAACFLIACCYFRKKRIPPRYPRHYRHEAQRRSENMELDAM